MKTKSWSLRVIDERKDFDLLQISELLWDDRDVEGAKRIFTENREKFTADSYITEEDRK